MICDTDFLIGLLRGRKDAINFLESLSHGPDPLQITHVTLWELYQGAYNSERVHENLQEIGELLEFFELVPFSDPVARRYGMLVILLRRQGVTIGVMDTLIACVALEIGVPVVTSNERHFRETGVTILNWTT